jgi:predicted nucleic acid-binding protein
MYLLDTDHLSLIQRGGIQGQSILLRLRKAYPRLGKMDLRIAAIAFTQNATVLTRNHKDFGQIVNLKIEDWSIPR